MPSSFAAADALSSAAVSSFFGERLRFMPWRSGGNWAAGGADPDREPVEFQGVLSGAVGSQNLKGEAGGYGFEGTATTRDRMVSCDDRAWPAGAREKDRIVALEQPGQPVYEISSIVPDALNRTRANLVGVKS